ncbi:MAG: hypothetical protein E7L19_18280 [Acinetobacter baumannii]|nr:hypothetical protein [Acinetobacter baumannii]
MVRIVCAVSMVLAIAMGMSACQDRNSKNDGMHEASDPATSHDMNKNSGEFKHEVRQFQKPYDNQQAEQISLMV